MPGHTGHLRSALRCRNCHGAMNDAKSISGRDVQSLLDDARFTAQFPAILSATMCTASFRLSDLLGDIFFFYSGLNARARHCDLAMFDGQGYGNHYFVDGHYFTYRCMRCDISTLVLSRHRLRRRYCDASLRFPHRRSAF